MKRKVALVLLLFAVAIKGQTQTFKHPGILHTQADFNRMKAKVEEGVYPWKASWDLLVVSGYARLDWAPRPADTVRRGGTGDNVAVLYKDIAAAYQNALIWKINGDSARGNKAVEILNAWSATHVFLTGNADRYLASGLFGYQFANIAEMMRGYPGFDLERFKNYMLNVFYYPLVERFLYGNEYGDDHNDACISNYRANWDLCNMAAMLAIGILCDNREIYNKGIEYFKSGGGNGAVAHTVPYLHSSTLGQWEESGRDQPHTVLGVGLMGSVCEIAWHQGDDLYSWDDSRFRKGAEYVAKYNLGKEVPYTFHTWGTGQRCSYAGEGVISEAGRGAYFPVWELIYNHYAVRAGQRELIPNIAEMAANHRPEGGPGGHPSTFDRPGFGTLTCTLETPLWPAGYNYCSAEGETCTFEGRIDVAYGANGSFQYLYNVSGDSINCSGAVFGNQGSDTTNACFVRKTLGSVPNGIYQIIAKHSDKALEVEGNGTGNGTNVWQWSPNDCVCQQWQIKDKGDGKYTIVSVSSRKNLEVSDTSTANGANIHIWESTGLDNQKFTFTPTGEDYYRITPIHSGKSVDVNRVSTADSANVHQWTYVRGDNQRWRLEYLGNVITSAQSDDGSSISPCEHVIIVEGENAPDELTATVVDDRVHLSWSPVRDAVSYIVKRSIISGGPYTEIATELDSTSFVDTDLLVGTTYYYIITAVNFECEGQNSSEASASLESEVTPPAADVTAKPGKLFSPDNNGDVSTETWLIENAYLLNGCEITVYNRQGQKVYSSIGYLSPWDGTSNGRPLPDGAYFYIIRYPDQKTQTGSVTIARLK